VSVLDELPALSSADDDATATTRAADNGALSLTVSTGATVAIDGASGVTVTFTGALKLGDALAFTGQVAGLAGSDALDLADVSFGLNTRATFLGNTAGGITVTDGMHAANIALQGDCLSSALILANDGKGGARVD
jgi:hypothetical protein